MEILTLWVRKASRGRKSMSQMATMRHGSKIIQTAIRLPMSTRLCHSGPITTGHRRFQGIFSIHKTPEVLSCRSGTH
jgi:hypothetical protein